VRAAAVTPAPDPTGLGGERLARLSAEGEPTVVELWCYPTTRDFEAIADAWYMHGGKVAAERHYGAIRSVRVTRSA
jgi:hypothetical protein